MRFSLTRNRQYQAEKRYAYCGMLGGGGLSLAARSTHNLVSTQALTSLHTGRRLVVHLSSYCSITSLSL